MPDCIPRPRLCAGSDARQKTVLILFISMPCFTTRVEEQFLNDRMAATQHVAAVLLFLLITAWCGSGLGVVTANFRRPPECVAMICRSLQAYRGSLRSSARFTPGRRCMVLAA